MVALADFDTKRMRHNLEASHGLLDDVKQILDGKYGDVPCSAVGLYTYYSRLAQGLRQFMCGGRKFGMEHITRDDICALTRTAADVSGLRYVMDIDKEEVDTIL